MENNHRLSQKCAKAEGQYDRHSQKWNSMQSSIPDSTISSSDAKFGYLQHQIQLLLRPKYFVQHWSLHRTQEVDIFQSQRFPLNFRRCYGSSSVAYETSQSPVSSTKSGTSIPRFTLPCQGGFSTKAQEVTRLTSVESSETSRSLRSETNAPSIVMQVNVSC